MSELSLGEVSEINTCVEGVGAEVGTERLSEASPEQIPSLFEFEKWFWVSLTFFPKKS